MRFMISGQGWPVQGGAWLVPAGTIIDSTTWTGPTQMPMDCIALDAASAQQMLVWFNQDYGRLWPQIVFHPSVNRAAVFATVVAQMNWAHTTPPPG
jgi:hypothetical protein